MKHLLASVGGSRKCVTDILSEMSEITNTDQSNILFRKPNSTDGNRVFKLINECKPLDVNSMYCNLLQCSHFRDTAILAESQGQLAGFVSGYRVPEQPDVLFVWQVAVAPHARGQGLASQMLARLIEQQGPLVRFVHTSITAANEASWSTFRRLARDLDAELATEVMFDQQQHFDGAHATETLVSIGPFAETATPSLEPLEKQ
ncbi:diaminobutyrate acetyltransferase [Candidatus Thalassolituus haligoni]|jgi:L-2,4-diaminobutyric acid acetyltransferase|uniref:diaminobutyrate acetyltransferase n=1 Tax=Candidatus Thalassolituus haligoni TaxID=3100113 RepID=UPI0035167C78|tara:strand:+ start:5956 stop:6564 length:609 start_codon:yes stop_codon:yes gene_type:complete